MGKYTISVRELVVLNKHGCIPEKLHQCWNDPKSGFNSTPILSMLDSWDSTKTVRNVFLGISVFLTMLAILVIEQQQFAWLMVIIILFCSFITQFMIILYTPALTRFAQDVVDAYYAGLPILRNAKNTDIHKEAMCVLVQLAEDVIWVQKGVGIVSNEAEEKRLKFKNAHTIFLRFGLVTEDWSLFFSEAEKKVAERENTNRKTAVSVK